MEIGVKTEYPWHSGMQVMAFCPTNIQKYVIVDEHKFMIFCITESAFFKSHNSGDIELKNYKNHFSKILDNPNLEASRVTVYIHQDLTVKIREDLMNDTFSSVWLELGKPRQKRSFLCIIQRLEIFETVRW